MDFESRFKVIYQANFDKYFLFAYKMLKDKDLAMDAVQEVFSKLWEKRKSVDPGQNVEGYLMTSLRNTILNTIRNNKKRIVDSLYETQIDQLISNLNTGRVVRDEELRVILLNAIQQLPKRKRQIYKLKVFNGLSNVKIAEKLNISEGTVSVQISQTSRYIKELLKQNF